MKNISKKLSATLSLVLIFVMIFSQNVFASNGAEISQASLTPNGQSRLSDSKYFVEEYQDGDFLYKIYRYHENGYTIIDPNLTDPQRKINTGFTVELTETVTYTGELSLSFAQSVGMSAGLADLLEIVIERTFGLEATLSATISRETSVSYHISENDPAGFYKIGLLHDYERYYVEVYMARINPPINPDDVSPAYVPEMFVKSGDVFVPIDVVYTALLYSPQSNGEYIPY